MIQAKFKTILIFLFLINGKLISQKINYFKGSNNLNEIYIDTVPFELDGGLIFVNVFIGEKKYKFMLDLGAPYVLDNSEIITTKSRILKTEDIIDANKNSSKGYIIETPLIKLGKMEFKNIVGYSNEYKNNPFINCTQSYGFLGSNFFQDLTLQINMKSRLLIISNQSQRLISPNDKIEKFTIDNLGRPYFKYQVSRNQFITGLFDSGNGGILRITSKDLKKAIAKKNISQIDNCLGLSSFSHNSSIRSKLVEEKYSIDNLKLGDILIKNIEFIHCEHYSNTIGVKLLDYGTLTLDFKSNNYVFKTDSSEFYYNKTPNFGFEIDVRDSTYHFGSIYKNGSASLAKIKDGFRILKINGIDLSKRTPEIDCQYYLDKLFNEQSLNIIFIDEENSTRETTLFSK